MNDNPLAKMFIALSNTINGAEKSFLDLLSALVPYFVPVIPAYLTYYHTVEQMQFPSSVALTAAFVVEVLGITAVSTAIRFWRHNLRYKTAENKAPFWLAVVVYLFYIIIVLVVNVLLEIVAGKRDGMIILSIALFTMLSVPSGVLISIRSQYAEMLEERNQRRTETKSHATNMVFAKDNENVPFGETRPKIEKICESCHKTFITSFPNKRTCSDACRKRLSRSKSVSGV